MYIGPEAKKSARREIKMGRERDRNQEEGGRKGPKL
jgi:hypothetical protein